MAGELLCHAGQRRRRLVTDPRTWQLPHREILRHVEVSRMRGSTFATALVLAACSSAPPREHVSSSKVPAARSSAPAAESSAGVLDVAAGTGHACALLRDGSVRCWGKNDLGQLGDGTRTSKSRPVGVAGLDRVARIFAAGDTTCA